MAERTLIAHKLEFNTRRFTDETYAPSDIEGEDLTDIFYNWCANAQLGDTCDNKYQILLNAKKVHRPSPYIVLVNTDIGRWGEPADVYSASKGIKVSNLEEDHAPTVETRIALLVPPQGDIALYFSEYCGRECGGTRLLPCFSKFWYEYKPDVTMKKSRAIDADAWNESATLRQVEVKSFAKTSDRADASKDIFGTISHVLRPKRNKRLSNALIDLFRTQPREAYKMLEIDESRITDNAQIWVTVEGDTGSKRILLNDPTDGLWFRELLSESFNDKISDGEFVAHCTSWAEKYLPRYGFCWKKEWS